MSYGLPFQKDQRLIELGGGTTPVLPRPPARNVDRIAGPTVDVVADLNGPLPLEAGSCDGVYAGYLWEHVSWRRVKEFATEIHRILSPRGIAVLVIPNTLEQCRLVVERGKFDEREAQMLFGDQNYAGQDWEGNAHHAGFSPEFVFDLLRGVGFEHVTILRHPNPEARDMIVEAKKSGSGLEHDHAAPAGHSALALPEDKSQVFNSAYFNGGGTWGGYAREGLWDFPVHWTTFAKVMERKPESVLEIGAARGYILKRLEDAGVRAKGLEVSRHCFLTRVVNDIVTWDMTKAPWPVADQAFDLCLSIATLEHIPEDKLPVVIQEMQRTCKRGLHGVDLGEHDDGFDKTHVTLKSLNFWKERLPATHEVVDKEDLERGAIVVPPGDGAIKLNIGSYRVMSHHGWINLDLEPLGDWARQYQYRFLQYDIRKGLPYDDGIVSLIYCSHLLEHLPYDQGVVFLKECRRVMKPGGVTRLIVPNAMLLAGMYRDGKLAELDEISPQAAASPHGARKFWELLLSNHEAIYDGALLVSILKDAGFQQAVETSFRKSLSPQILIETLDMFAALSLYADGVA